MIKNFLKKIIDKTGYIVLKKDLPFDMRQESAFLQILGKCSPYTMVPPDRSFALYGAVKYLSENNVAGDIVECGVWRGGQTMLASFILLENGDSDRDIWLFDTYTGMSKPSEHDEYVFGGRSSKDVWEATSRGDHNDWCYASLDEVKKNVFSTGYPKEKYRFVKGMVESTLTEKTTDLPEKIALLRLDTDFYESTLVELETLYPRLVQGGVLLIDDYGSWTGARKAVEEYFNKKNKKPLLIKVGEGRIGVKVV